MDTIAASFSDLDAERAADYQRNAEEYKAQLQTVHDDLTSTLEQVPTHQRALVTCEGAFSYLARDAGLTEKYIWPVNSESQATPQQIASAMEFVSERDVPAVFCESTVSGKAMRQIADATDARFAGTLYVDSLSGTDGPVPTYLDLIRHAGTTIAQGLTGEGE